MKSDQIRDSENKDNRTKAALIALKLLTEKGESYSYATLRAWEMADDFLREGEK